KERTTIRNPFVNSRKQGRARASARRRRAWRRRCRTRRRAPRGLRRSATRGVPGAARAAGRARRSSPNSETSSTRQATSTAVPHQPSLRSPRTASWAHRLLQQLSGPAMHRELSLQLLDPPARLAQLLALLRAQSGQLTPTDLLLPPPDVDRLVADLEQTRDLTHRLARRDEIQRPPTELRRIPLPCHQRPPESSLEAARV